MKVNEMHANNVDILIKKASLEFDKASNPLLSGYDLTASQFNVLKFLYFSGTRTARIADIQRHYSMTHPTATGLLDHPERKGFASRAVNAADARSRPASLTEKSERLEPQLLAVGGEIEARLTERLSPKERAQLMTLLQKLLGKGI